MTDFTQIMDEVRLIMENSIKLNFTEGGRPVPWAPRKYDLFGNPLLFSSGSLYGSIYSVSNEDTAEAGARMTIHQTGGTFLVPITDRSRGFFWVMWFNTGDPHWKWMALTTRAVFIIHIPARPYVMFQQEDIAAIIALVMTRSVEFVYGSAENQEQSVMVTL